MSKDKNVQETTKEQTTAAEAINTDQANKKLTEKELKDVVGGASIDYILQHYVK